MPTGEEAKIETYYRAIEKALHDAAVEAGEPDINAAIGALHVATAELISRIGDRNARRLAIKAGEASIPRLVANRVNARQAAALRGEQ